MLVRKNLKRLVASAVIIGMVAVLFVPGAAAQQFDAKLTPGTPTVSPDLIFPESGTGKLTVPFTFSLPNDAYSIGGFAEPGITINAKTNCPAYVQITGATSKVINYPPQQGSTQDQFDFIVTVGRDAPGLTGLKCSVTLSSETAAGGQLTGVTAPAVDFLVKADYYSLIQAKLSKKVQQAGPQKDVPFDIELSNFGNSRTQIAFEVANKPEGGKWNVLVPENIILESPNTGVGSPNDIATVTITTTYKNGWNNEQGAFQVLMKPTSADQPDKIGNSLSANMLVRVRGVYVPGFEPVMMLGTVLGAVLVARMRREDDE